MLTLRATPPQVNVNTCTPFAAGVIDSLPDSGLLPDHAPLAAQLDASALLQLSVVLWPWVMLDADADSVTVGSAAELMPACVRRPVFSGSSQVFKEVDGVPLSQDPARLEEVAPWSPEQLERGMDPKCTARISPPSTTPWPLAPPRAVDVDGMTALKP